MSVVYGEVVICLRGRDTGSRIVTQAPAGGHTAAAAEAAKGYAMEIHESAEDYLETILILEERNGMVRSIDIVNEMGFSKPSVSIAMKKLRENGYIQMDTTGYITLCPKGLEIADRIYSRHKLLRKMLIAVGVEEEKAAQEACRIEHVIDDDTYEKLRSYYDKCMAEQPVSQK